MRTYIRNTLIMKLNDNNLNEIPQTVFRILHIEKIYLIQEHISLL